jgi:methyl-accepting chemotaxis protein
MTRKEPRKSGGLFLRIFAISVVCISIPMLISMLTASLLSKQYYEDLSSSSLHNIAVEKKNQLESALINIEKQAFSIASQTFIIDSLSKASSSSKDLDPSDLQKISDNLQANFKLGDGLFENMFLMYKNKDVADGIGGKSVGWENEAVGSTKSLLIRPVTQSPTTGRPVMTIVAPVTSNDKHLGTIGLAIELNNVSKKIIEGDSLDNSFKTLIVNSAGLVISSANPDQVLTLDFQNPELGLQNYYNTITSVKSGVDFFALDGIESIAAYSYSERYGMYVITYKPVAAYRQMTNSLSLILAIVILFGIVIASIIIYFSSKKITKPIIGVAEQAEQLSDGNLAVNIPEGSLKRKDELGRLSNAFFHMIHSLRTVIKQITETSEQVAASSEELYASGEQVGKAAENVGAKILEIASGARQQSSQIDSALSNLSNLIGQIDEVNTKTAIMEETTARMINDISAGSRSAAESIDKINKLKVSTEDVSKVITELGHNSNQIGQIIELISGIAEQTNMLALNAAIEAARAGDAGRGFSVVADEIRKLAEESANASGRIANLIVEVRGGVDTAVEKMDDSIKSVDSCVTVFEENGRIFHEINGQTEQLKNIVADVTRSVRAMTENSGDFECTMQDINKVSQEFVSNCQDVTASSEEQTALTEEIISFSKAMAVMAVELSNLNSNFKL